MSKIVITILFLISISTPGISQEFLSHTPSDTLEYKYEEYHDKFADSTGQCNLVIEYWYFFPNWVGHKTISNSLIIIYSETLRLHLTCHNSCKN